MGINNMKYFCYIVIVSSLMILTTGCSGFGKIKIMGDEYIFLPFPVSKVTKTHNQDVSISKNTPAHSRMVTSNLTAISKRVEK